jgi:hypothetical protein
MPYPAGHRAVTREKIVDSARKLFNQHGFDSVSVRQIMAGTSHDGDEALSQSHGEDEARVRRSRDIGR